MSQARSPPECRTAGVPPVPVYVTNTVLESEVASTPVMLVAVIPGSTDVSTGVVANCQRQSDSPAGGHLPRRRSDWPVFKLAIFRSVSVAAGVTVAPIMCLPSLVADQPVGGRSSNPRVRVKDIARRRRSVHARDGRRWARATGGRRRTGKECACVRYCHRNVQSRRRQRRNRRTSDAAPAGERRMDQQLIARRDIDRRAVRRKLRVRCHTAVQRLDAVRSPCTGKPIAG